MSEFEPDDMVAIVDTMEKMVVLISLYKRARLFCMVNNSSSDRRYVIRGLQNKYSDYLVTMTNALLTDTYREDD